MMVTKRGVHEGSLIRHGKRLISKKKKEIIGEVMNEVNKSKTLDDRILSLTQEIQILKRVKKPDFVVKNATGPTRRLTMKYRMKTQENAIKELEAMLKTMKEKQEGRWEKKELPPSQPAPTAVERTLDEIRRKSKNIPSEKHVAFIQDIAEKAPVEVLGNIKVRQVLKKATPTIELGLFNALLEEAIKEKQLREKK